MSTAEALSSQITRLSPRPAVAAIKWRLVHEAGATVYEFEATYTLTQSDDGLKVVAIAHNEQLRAREAMTSKKA